MRQIAKIIVHCSDTETGTTAAIRAYHMRPVAQGGRGWNDIGYHWVIERDGSLHAGRDEAEVGAHCEGDNSDSIGICMVGVADFAPCQLLTMRKLLRMKVRDFGLSPADVHCHYEMPSGIKQGKTCPNIKGPIVRFIVEEEKP
jgi:hypothetical protein